MVIWPQNQLRDDRQGLHCHPSPNTHLVNLPDSGKPVTRVNQGLFSTTLEAEKRDPGNEVGNFCDQDVAKGELVPIIADS